MCCEKTMPNKLNSKAKYAIRDGERERESGLGKASLGEMAPFSAVPGTSC